MSAPDGLGVTLSGAAVRETGTRGCSLLDRGLSLAYITYQDNGVPINQVHKMKGPVLRDRTCYLASRAVTYLTFERVVAQRVLPMGRE